MFVIYTSDQIIYYIFGEWAICCKFKEDEKARTGRLRHGGDINLNPYLKAIRSAQSYIGTIYIIVKII